MKKIYRRPVLTKGLRQPNELNYWEPESNVSGLNDSGSNNSNIDELGLNKPGSNELSPETLNSDGTTFQKTDLYGWSTDVVLADEATLRESPPFEEWDFDAEFERKSRGE